MSADDPQDLIDETVRDNRKIKSRINTWHFINYLYMRNSLRVINCVRTIVIGSMNIRTDNALNYKCHTLGSATYVVVTGPMTVRIGNAAEHKCNTSGSAVHIAVELYISTCLQ